MRCLCSNTRACCPAGTLAEAWGDITSLQSLDLSHNSISGPLPQAWAGSREAPVMQNLTHLDLSYNLLSTSVPNGKSKRSTPYAAPELVSIHCFAKGLSSIDVYWDAGPGCICPCRC